MIWKLLGNRLVRSVTKWSRACDLRSARLISYTHHTTNYKQYCHVGNQAKLGLFQDADFAGNLTDSKSTSGGVLCMFGSHTFVPISWACKKQRSVSHGSTEAEIKSLANYKWRAIPAVSLWNTIIKKMTAKAGGDSKQKHQTQIQKPNSDPQASGSIWWHWPCNSERAIIQHANFMKHLQRQTEL